MIHAHTSLFFTAAALIGGLALFALADADAAEHCPDKGIRIVPEKILDAEDAEGRPVIIECPAYQAGIGVPGWGHIGIGFGSANCPASQTKVEAHAEVVPKEGFKVSANSSYKVFTRKVSCETKKNFVLIGLPACKHGEWIETAEHTDWKEELCEF